MGEQIGTALVGSTTTKELFKSSLGPNDVVACNVKGNQAQSIPMGAAMIDDAANSGFKKRYTNATSVNDEAVGTGDGSTTTFDLDNANVKADSLKVFDADGDLIPVSLSAGTGTGGVDQIVCDIAPANAKAIKADYDHGGISTNACILMQDVVTTSGGGNVTADACRDGSVDSKKVVDSAGNAVDKYFKAALSRVSFD